MPLVTANQFQLVPNVGQAVSQGLQAGGQLQALKGQQQAMDQAKQKQEWQQRATTALELQGLDSEGQVNVLRRRIAQSSLAGEDNPEAQEMLGLIMTGETEQLDNYLNKSVDIGQRMGVIKAPTAAGAGFKDVQIIGGKVFGTGPGGFQEVPTGPAATKALREQETAKQEAAKAKATAEQQKTIFTQTQSLRKEFESVTKPQQQSVEAYRSFKALQTADAQLLGEFKGNFGAFADPKVNKEKILGDAQAISDVALIFAFFKTVDPTSTVREGEFATVQNSGSVATQFQNTYNRLLRGERLNKAQRDQIIRIAENKSKSAEKKIANVTAKFKKLSKGQGIDSNLVIVPEQGTGDLTPNEQAELIRLRQQVGQ